MAAQRLKGIWGLIETISVVVCAASFYYNVFARPAVMTPHVGQFYLMVTVLGVAGALGIAYTQVLRYRMRNRPDLQDKYTQPAAVARSGSVTVMKENWSPLKKWSTLIAIAALICLAFIAALILFVK